MYSPTGSVVGVAKTWSQFERILAFTLVHLDDGNRIRIGPVATPENHVTLHVTPSGLHAEAVCSFGPPELQMFSSTGAQYFGSLGWTPSTDADRRPPVYVADLPWPVQPLEVARLVMATVTQVMGTKNPSDLEFTPNPHEDGIATVGVLAALEGRHLEQPQAPQGAPLRFRPIP